MAKQDLVLTIALRDDIDEEQLDRVTCQLRGQIMELDVRGAFLATYAEMPTGAKGDALSVGNIIVALTSAGVFTGLIELVKSWALHRRSRTVMLKAKVGERELELNYSPEATSAKELERFTKTIINTLRCATTPVAKE